MDVAIRVVLLALLLSAGRAWAFGFEDVDRLARHLAGSNYSAPSGNLPKELQGITYDQYRDIRYRRDRFLWGDGKAGGGKASFELAFFHQGLFYDTPVRINEIDAQGVREVRFDPELFDYGQNKLDPQKLRGLGFAGFRVHYPVNTEKYKDEVLVFLGASYFRALGKGQLYGLSARGLAIDTALASGEEFPRFTEYWIERPGPKATELVIYALLDSRRATGAYRFVLRPGTETVMDVRARLYLRSGVGKLGLAPLTSMFYYGENQRPPREDYRPEVHDSDGLSVLTGTGEWIWRPLVNPRRLTVTTFAVTNPGGFGLMQRDRDFGRYEDLEARYDLRPSAWVEPRGQWGAGRVELVLIPSPDETNDNVVAYWVPDYAPQPKEPFDYEYRVRWQKEGEARPPLSWVAQTRRGHGYQRKPDNTIVFNVDFEGPALRKYTEDGQLQAVVTADGNAQLVESEAHPNYATRGWRLRVRLRRLDDAKPVELRAFLRGPEGALSETWSYLLPPP